MALATLLAITIVCIGWSLWIRRVTWTCRWEVAATLNIALQGAAVLLMSPLASETVGHWLHALTGKWNLEDYIGHDCYIVAASAIVYNTLGRLADDDAMQKSFKQYVERPATLCIPLLLVTFSIGNGARIYEPDFFKVPTDFWLNALLAAPVRHLIYLLGYGIRATLVLRKDPRSRRIANFYLVASVRGITGVHRADHHRLRASPADNRGRQPGLAVRLPVRRGVRARVRAFVAHKDEVVHPRQSLTPRR